LDDETPPPEVKAGRAACYRHLAMRLRRAVFGLVLVLAACGGPTDPEADPSDCTVVGQNRQVRETMRDNYLWYREMPDPSPASFASPEAYLEAVRYKTLDSGFSYITTRAAANAFFNDGQVGGYGVRTILAGSNDLRVIDAYAGSPAADAGLDRGSQILAVNGRTVAQILAAGELGAIFDPPSLQVRFRDRAGREREAAMARRTITIPTVPVVQTYRVGTHTVGYVLLESFVAPSTAALDAAFAQLKAAGADELVLDVRYNGGGLVDVAQHLAALIAGPRTAGQPFVRFAHNDKNKRLDSDRPFPPAPAQALAVPRLVVITTERSASASELMVNGLRPFMSVTTVGSRTYGKPVGQYGYEFCDKTLYLVAFATLNARNEGDYFGGIRPDCPAPDDLGHAFGDPAEGALAESLQFIRNGRCSTAAAADARLQSQDRPPLEEQPHREDGWRSLVGVY
jgi:carboxyl-terminal processing protease